MRTKVPLLATQHPEEAEERAFQGLVKWSALTSIVLIAVTWRLWTPQTGLSADPCTAGTLHSTTWFDWTAPYRTRRQF